MKMQILLDIGWVVLLLCVIRTAESSRAECRNYRVLSEESRSINFYSSASVKCDSGLATGWYRFIGKAGTQLSEKPILQRYVSPQRYRCQTHAISWLTSRHPSVADGRVTRQICFAWNGNSCFSGRRTIQVVNCGGFYVYYLTRTPGCSYRYCGDKVNPAPSQRKVVCNSTRMEIQLSRQEFNVSKYQNITLKSSSCRAVISASYITLGSKPNLCGSTKQETSTHIIYTNQVFLTVKQGNNLISRDEDQAIMFSCSYKKEGHASKKTFVPVSRRVTANESSIGSFTFELEMHQSSSYSKPYSSYPVTVKLSDRLYFQTKASVEDNDLVLLIDKCYSTPTMNKNDNRKYTFIERGCPKDNTVRFHAANRQNQRFSMQAFRYLNNQATVYIHCLVLLCRKSSQDARCRSGCSGNNVNRAKRDLSGVSTMQDAQKSFSEYYMVEEGPIKLADEKTTAGSSSSNASLQTTVTGLVVGIALLAMIVVALFIVMKRKWKQSKNGNQEVGIDNPANGKVYTTEDEVAGTAKENVM